MAIPGSIVNVGKLVTPGGAQGPPGQVVQTSPLADTTQDGLLRKVSGLTTDFVDGSNHCQSLLPRLRHYNSIRNPIMQIVQRGVGPIAFGATNGIDGWLPSILGPTATWSQIAVAIPPDPSSNQWYPYTAYAHRVTITAGKPALAVDNYCTIYQNVEGFMAEQLKGNPTSISLLVRSSITGTFTVTLRDKTGSAYVYVMEVALPVANVWTRVALPNIPAFPGTAADFPDGNVKCYDLLITIAIGSTYATSTLNSWKSTSAVLFGSTTQSNFAATTGTTFDFTLVKHEPNPFCTPFIPRNIQEETNLNYRYLWYPGGGIYLGWILNSAWTYEMGRMTWPVPMRAPPTLMPGSAFSVSAGNTGTPIIVAISTYGNIYNNASNWTLGAWASFNGGVTAEL